jgi:hypothetical protein
MPMRRPTRIGRDDVQHNLPRRGAHRPRRLDLFLTDRAYAGARRQRHRREDGEEQQDDLRGFADAEPDHHQRQIGERRQRPVELDRQIEDSARDAGNAHRQADRDGDRNGEDERREDARHAGGEMVIERMPVDVAGERLLERAPDRFRPLQEQRLDPTRMRRDSPRGEHQPGRDQADAEA